MRQIIKLIDQAQSRQREQTRQLLSMVEQRRSAISAQTFGVAWAMSDPMTKVGRNIFMGGRHGQ